MRAHNLKGNKKNWNKRKFRMEVKLLNFFLFLVSKRKYLLLSIHYKEKRTNTHDSLDSIYKEQFTNNFAHRKNTNKR